MTHQTTPCAKSCGRPASTAKAGLAGAARVAGLCYQCWRASRGGNGQGGKSAPAGRKSLGYAFGELAGLVHKLDEISRELVGDSAELLERCRRAAHEIHRRIGVVRGVAPQIEQRVREANAELRRQVKLGQSLKAEIGEATKALPGAFHGTDGVVVKREGAAE